MRRTNKRRKHKKRRGTRRLRGGGSNIYISGEAFKNVCKYNLCDRYPIKGIDSTLEEGDRVFLTIGEIDKFIKSPPSKKVVLVFHNIDDTFDDTMMNRLKEYVSKVYSINSSAKDALQIPIGFRDDMYTPHSVLDEVKASSQNSTRDILCYLNFSVGFDKENERNIAIEAFKDKPWAVINTNTTPALHLQHTNPDTIRLRKEFYTTLTKIKFAVCPFGAGKDTHRVYESLFFGAIPIIKTSFLDPMYEKLGECWIVNDWSDVTEDECKRRWDSRNNKKFQNNVEFWLQ